MLSVLYLQKYLIYSIECYLAAFIPYKTVKFIYWVAQQVPNTEQMRANPG